MEKDRVYICIDLKSFYASVECVERGLDPFSANLVVADPGRCVTTICLAVSPSLKDLGVPSRCRVFEIPKGIDYTMAVPRMQLYIDYSAEIYGIYLKYISKEDMHVYSIDEVFMDVTNYLEMYQMTAKELAATIMEDVLNTTGISSRCGIGSNLYLAKIALDITAKHSDDNIGILDEELYKKTLWNHKPITDFWRVGNGIAGRLENIGIMTMGQIAGANEDILYKIFGIDAELLIDHAWGRETTLMEDIKTYKPKSNSISNGQVLDGDYNFDDGKLIIKEMADILSLELVDKGLVTDSITLHVGYSNQLKLKPAHGTIRMTIITSSAKQIISYTERLYERIIDRNKPIRRMTLTFNNVVDEVYHQYDLFTDPVELEKEYKMQKAILDIKEKFGKNAVLKGMNLDEKGKTIDRNKQIGGHKSG